ncbi:fructose-1,6-bisphosphatase class II [Serratia fonticola]|jgi:fructose-1,6-bisphosphatase II|uniref:Fructose-1,6-bisphosphatase n=1 Tax=Serratia fonticola TaxID=47917 RepID=A0A542BPW6_SERFO|nr:class II fructose-bisphosphatase [Serratia fonticola]TQI80628.1 fructose-1,6-bisphosphatase class II [Serratia fonticola]TQI97347.1 fructose-1,6-bisphosphatase class II [Serratia fonticola]TVZ71843.1 fructose-1,6-bisphosphatase class II [Serratia fonticola]
MKSLAYDIVRTTQQAALAAWPLLGCSDKNQIDGAAVAAMRHQLSGMIMQGQIVIGEGEIDQAPMLYIGERLGSGVGPAVDIAVDPIEGTRMVAMGQYNALAVIAFAPQNTLLHAPDMYMRKLAVGAGAKGAIDLRLPLEQNLRQVAEALGKPLEQLRMITLDKPRHALIRQQAQALGVKIFAIPDGDVAASLMTCLPNGEADIMYTLGGAPEGVISACAVRLLGGDMQAELIDFCQAKGETPQHRVWAQEEHRRCRNMGIEINNLLSLNDMIASDEVIFSATGITQGDIVGGIKQKEGYLSTETLMINGTDGSCNRIQTLHLH